MGDKGKEEIRRRRRKGEEEERYGMCGSAGKTTGYSSSAHTYIHAGQSTHTHRYTYISFKLTVL